MYFTNSKKKVMYNISKVIYDIEQLSECAKYFYDKKTLKP